MLALSSGWAVPKTDSIQDMGAADRYMQFHLGIFTHPIFVNGDYPDVVKLLWVTVVRLLDCKPPA